MSQTDHAPLLDRVRQVQDELQFALTDRAMFGEVMLYADGRPFASLSHAGFAIKLSGWQQQTLLRLPGATRLQYSEKDKPSRQYVVLPDSVVADDEHLVEWLHHSAAHAQGARPRRETG